MVLFIADNSMITIGDQLENSQGGKSRSELFNLLAFQLSNCLMGEASDKSSVPAV